MGHGIVKATAYLEIFMDWFAWNYASTPSRSPVKAVGRESGVKEMIIVI